MSPSTPAQAISTEIAGIHAAAFERDSERATTLLDDDLAMCVLRSALTPAESLLVANGHRATVHEQRQAFEHALGPTLRAAVERITARTVTSFLPTTHLVPGLILLTFSFAPARPPDA